MKRGYLISLVGSDGTGKSSIGELLKDRFQNEHYKAPLFYMGAINHILITSKILSKLSSLNKQRKPSEQNDAKIIKMRLSLVSLIKEVTFLHYIVELFARYFIWIRPRLKKGEVVITDRYIYDFLIINKFLNRCSWFREFIIWLIPSPDLLVCLYNNPDIILKRKKGNSNEETMRQNKIFLSLEQHVHSFKKFKTDGTLEEITDKIFMEAKNVMAQNNFIENHDYERIECSLACRLLKLLLIEENQGSAYLKEEIDTVFTVEQIYKLAKSNNMIMRLGRVINNTGDTAIMLRWENILRIERERCDKSAALIKEIAQGLDRENIKYAVIKTLDSYPDCGTDVDMFVDAPFKITKEWIRKVYNGKVRPRKIAEVMCGKMSASIQGYPILELHCRMMGQVGEQATFARSLTKNIRLFEAGGLRAYIPSKEEQVIIIAIHRLYRHLSFKISDIVNAITLLKEADFNWERLFKLSEDCGMSKGIAYLLGVLENIHTTYFNNGFMPERYKGLIDNGARLSFRHWFFRIPLFRVPPKLYAAEAFYFLRKGRVGSLARLSLIPVLSFIAYTTIKIFKDDWVW